VEKLRSRDRHLRQAEGPAPGAEDLLNLAALYIIERAGSVHAMTREEVPGGGDLAAQFRYRVRTLPVAVRAAGD
jgi:hypothetical protein